MVIFSSPAFIALSLALITLAAAFIVPVLWKSSPKSAWSAVLALPLLCISVYFLIGEPAALDAQNRRAPQSIDEAITQLERRLQADPDNIEGWLLLGRSQKAQGRAAERTNQPTVAAQYYQAAKKSLARAQNLAKDNPDISVEYVEARSLADPQRRFDDRSLALLDEVIAKNPQHERGLWFRGIAALQAQDFALAASTWEKLLPLIDQATRNALMPQLASAREKAGLPPLAPWPTSKDSPSIWVKISLDKKLADQFKPGSTLFVFARAVDGQGPPVAASRQTINQFPVTLSLSDANSIMPTQKLFQLQKVKLAARLSTDDDASAASGDLEATPVVIDVRDGITAELVIDKPIP